MYGISDYTPSISIGLFVGTLALWLISRELGLGASFSRKGQVFLFIALGTGVISVAAKAVMVAAFTQGGTDALVLAGRDWRDRADQVISTFAKSSVERPSRPLGISRRTWLALPAHPPGFPEGSPSDALIGLGRALFFDTNLSLDRTVSCATCHDLTHGGDDGRSVSLGVDGQTGSRNAPTVLNAAYLRRLFWDGRAASLEAQALGPLVNPVEMAMPSLDAVVERVAERVEYAEAFAEIFGVSDQITAERIAIAIAAFERTMLTPDTPYDRFVRGDDTALSGQQLRGMALFSEIGCRNCHTDPVFSAAAIERGTGVYRRFPIFAGNPLVDEHDLLINGQAASWRVPSLRNIADTAPYFHNGSVATLEEAIRIMVVSQLGRRLSEDPRDDYDVVISTVLRDGDRVGRDMTMFQNRALSKADIADIAAFLRALSGPVVGQVAGSIPTQFLQ